MKLNSKTKMAIAAALIGMGTALFYACNEVGNGAGLDANGNDTTGTIVPTGCQENVPAAASADTFSAPVSFSTDIQPIFDSKCTSCHGSGTGIGYSGTGGANGGLDLTSGHSYASLVRCRKTSEDSIAAPYFRVYPGNPDSSYLIEKLTTTTPKFGGRMPLSGSPLSADQISKITTWIQHGAPND